MMKKVQCNSFLELKTEHENAKSMHNNVTDIKETNDGFWFGISNGFKVQTIYTFY